MDDHSGSQGGRSNRQVAGIYPAKNRSESGFVLLLVLTLFAMISAYALEVYIKANFENKMVRRDLNSRQAFYAAEGGVEWAKTEIDKNPLFTGGGIMVGEGIVQVQVVPQAVGFVVTSSSEYGAARRKLLVQLEKSASRWHIRQYQELHQ